MSGPFLVIAPLSTISHWQREFERCTDMYTVVFKDGAEGRKIIKKYDWSAPNDSKRLKFDVLITTYEVALASSNMLKRIKWGKLLPIFSILSLMC